MEERILTIGFDAKRVVNNATGLGNYGRTLINNLEADEGLRLRLYSPVEGNPKLIAQLHHRERLTFCYPQHAHTRLGRDWWRLKSMVTDLRRDGIDLFHGLSGELPLGIRRTGVRSLVTIHDLIFLRHPEWYHPLDVRIYSWKFRRTLREADHIVAISELTKRDIIELGGVDAGRISVVYQDCDEAFKRIATAQERQSVRRCYELPEHYILSVGSIEERKNVLLVVKALELMDAGVHLVVVGRHTPYTDQVNVYAASHGMSERVHILHGVPFHDLPAIYQEASAFVYPSRYEGFGIPIIEAAYSGLPIVAGTCGCLQEAGGPSALYVDPDDARGMAQALTKVLGEGKRSRRSRDGRRYVERFATEKVTRQMTELYRELAAQRP